MRLFDSRVLPFGAPYYFKYRIYCSIASVLYEALLSAAIVNNLKAEMSVSEEVLKLFKLAYRANTNFVISTVGFEVNTVFLDKSANPA